MTSPRLRALAINCGSSSLKAAVFEVGRGGGGGAEERLVARAVADRVGPSEAEQAAAANGVFDQLEAQGIRPDVVGHRVVRGGPDHTKPVRVDAALLSELESLVPFAPLHLPVEMRAIRFVAARWPDLPQVACFDTSFHRTIPEIARRFAIPQAFHDAGFRRYGFHGLSYEFVVSAIGAETLGRAVIAHLGSGASMAAVREGLSVDTTMGFTPMGGLVMGTRPGDLDPGLVVTLAARGLDAQSLEDLFNHRCGLLALSGSTADVRDLLARRSSDERAAMALDVFVWSARRWVGAMTASLGGLDTLVFTGGIGEHSPAIRGAIADGLEHLGVRLDAARNARGDGIISAEGTGCIVRVVATDEERMVARHACAALGDGTAAALP